MSTKLQQETKTYKIIQANIKKNHTHIHTKKKQLLIQKARVAGEVVSGLAGRQWLWLWLKRLVQTLVTKARVHVRRRRQAILDRNGTVIALLVAVRLRSCAEDKGSCTFRVTARGLWCERNCRRLFIRGQIWLVRGERRGWGRDEGGAAGGRGGRRVGGEGEARRGAGV